MRWLSPSLFLALILAGCGRGASNAPGEPVASPPAEADAVERSVETPAADPEPAASTPQPVASSAQELYESCEARVEQPEADGECASDADCVKAGCSSEICTTAEAASDIMSTCEVLPCFSVLDACGCVDGRCRWSIADKVPAAPMPPLMLPQ